MGYIPPHLRQRQDAAANANHGPRSLADLESCTSGFGNMSMGGGGGGYGGGGGAVWSGHTYTHTHGRRCGGLAARRRRRAREPCAARQETKEGTEPFMTQ